VTVALAIVIVGLASLPNWLGPVKAVLVGLALAGAAFAVVSAQMRQRAYSRSGKRWFVAIQLVWVVWGMLVLQWAVQSGWIASDQPPLARDWHFVSVAVAATIPLLLGALVIGRGR
jgi:hypothetical protein